MNVCELEYIPVAQAFLCEDCHCIGNCSVQCPACASEALLNLAKIVNREEECTN